MESLKKENTIKIVTYFSCRSTRPVNLGPTKNILNYINMLAHKTRQPNTKMTTS